MRKISERGVADERRSALGAEIPPSHDEIRRSLLIGERQQVSALTPGALHLRRTVFRDDHAVRHGRIFHPRENPHRPAVSAAQRRRRRTYRGDKIDPHGLFDLRRGNVQFRNHPGRAELLPAEPAPAASERPRRRIEPPFKRRIGKRSLSEMGEKNLGGNLLPDGENAVGLIDVRRFRLAAKPAVRRFHEHAFLRLGV